MGSAEAEGSIKEGGFPGIRVESEKRPEQVLATKPGMRLGD